MNNSKTTIFACAKVNRHHIFFLKLKHLVNNSVPSSIFSFIVMLGLGNKWDLLLYNELLKGQAVSLQRQATIPAQAYALLQHEDWSQWLWNLCNQLFLRSAVNRQYQLWENIKHLIPSPYLAFFNSWPALCFGSCPDEWRRITEWILVEDLCSVERTWQ